jgi:hypothetical protein
MLFGPQHADIRKDVVVVQALQRPLSMPARRRRRCASRGAVVVEFAIAIVPILIMFFTFIQLAQSYTATLVVRHAAYCGARTAAVILPPNPGETGDPQDVDRAVHLALGNWDKSFESVKIEKIPAPAPYELVTVEVTAVYKCSVPLGGRIACGADGLLELHTVVAKFPNQGARYKAGGGSGIGVGGGGGGGGSGSW